MGTLTLPADHLGSITARAGEAMLRRLCNVEAVVSGVPVVGRQRIDSRTDAIGTLQVQGVDLLFDCLAVDLPPGVREGVAVTIAAQPYLVKVRTDNVALGHVTLGLENAA